jgi:ATP-dependent Clp protease protease subunit
MAGLYADRTGKSKADIAKLMDAETWLSGEEAVADNFADALLSADAIVEDAKAAAEMHPKAALRRVDAMLAERGLPRSERRALIKEIKSDKSGAVAPATQDAGMSDLAASLRGLSETIRS